MSYLSHLIVYLGIYLVVAMSLNVVVGYCGYFTLAHAGYFAVGAYAYALASLKLGLGFFPAVMVGMIVAAVLSMALSLPSWRFKGDFFLLISLVVQALLFSLIQNWSSPEAKLGTFANLTNGSFGITGIPKPVIFGIKLDTNASVAVLSLAIAGLCGLVLRALLVSPWGRLLKSIRDDELAARTLGKNTRIAKIEAFAISGAMVAAAGATYAAHVTYIDPSAASLEESILMLCMVLVGGAGNFRGPLLGAFVLLAIPEFLRMCGIPHGVAASARLLAYGLLLVLMVHFRPQGIAGDYRVE